MPDYRLAIAGYGKMGKLVEHLAPEYGFDVALKLDVDNNANFEGLTQENFRDIDAAIDFSTPHAVARNAVAEAVWIDLLRLEYGTAARHGVDRQLRRRRRPTQ